MGDSADTARERQAAKKVPKRKPSADARAFGAATAIFVPPELQHETGPKPPPVKTSLVSRVPKRTESLSEKRTRLARETHARERLRIGLKIHTPTGANDLRAVPPPPPSRRVSILGGHASMPRPIHDIALGLGLAAKHGAIGAIQGVEDWAGDIASSVLYPTTQRGNTRISPRLQHVGNVGGQVARPAAATANYVVSEKGQQAIWGNSLVNLAAHGDAPNSAMDAAGLGVGILGVLPFGKVAQLARVGKGLRAAGKIGEALEMTPARQATYAALAAKYGQEEADNLILATDNIARQAAASKAESVAHYAEPDDWYKHNPISTGKFADFTPSPGAKTQFQTEAGTRQGLVEGTPRWIDNPDGEHTIEAGEYARLPDGNVGFVEDIQGLDAKVRMANGDLVNAKAHRMIGVLPDPSPPEVPVFYSDLQREVAKLPLGGYGKEQTIATLKGGVKDAEWRDSGMQDFFDQFSANEKIPPAAIQGHLATSLNAYNLDEIVYSSNVHGNFGTIWDEYKDGGLIVKRPTAEEPYYEVVMRLKKPLYERITPGIMGGGKRVKAPYEGVGMNHWKKTDVVAHMRFHIITDTEGKKSLLVEEIQSDWAKNWRDLEKGGGIQGAKQRLADLEAKLAGLERDYQDAHVDPRGEFDADVYDLERELEKTGQEIQDAKKEIRDTPGPPPLGSKQADAAVKRLLRFAHDANVDRIIIPRGDVQAIRNVSFDTLPSGRKFSINPANEADVGRALDDADRWKAEVQDMSHEELAAYAASHQGSGAVKTMSDLYERQYPKLFEKNMGEKGALKSGVYLGRFSDQTGAITGRKTRPMDAYVIEMTQGAKAKAAAPMAYYQQRAWDVIPKGATEFFADGTRAIHLFEDADISTILHELAHVGYADMNEVDRAILGRHFNGFKTTADHEAYARSFERYIYEGHAMTSDLDGVFAKLKTWMHGVYQHVNQIGAVVHPEVARVFDRMVVQQESPEAQLVRMLKSAPKVRKAQAAGYSVERGKRIEQMFEEWPEDASIDEVNAAMGALKGELPKEAFTGLDELAPESVASIVKSIRISNRVRRFEKVRAFKAVIKATEGEVPTDSEILLLNKIFDGNVHFAKETMGRVEKLFVEVWNIPRSIAASFDLSAPLRQGFIAGTRHPVVFSKAFKPMFEALFSAKRAEEIAAEIASRENYVHYGRGKLAVETSASSADLAMREEQFYSSYAERFWPVKWSGRAYEAFLHRLRADIFDLTMEAGRAANRPVESDEFVEGLGRMVNQMTGRGTLPETHLLRVETAAPLLNTFLFSPRLLASRVNMISPVYYTKLWKSDPFLFAEATKNLATTVGAVGIVLGTVTAIGMTTNLPVTVGWDPTSANFGKIRIGDTRIDIMAGFSPLLVFLAREVLGRSTSSTTGKSQNLQGGFGHSSRLDIAFRFAQSKAAPTTSIGLDWMRGQTFVGDPVTPWGELKNSSAPMMLRDVLDAWRSPKDPVDAIVAGGMALALGTFGIGVSTYKAKKKKSRGGSTSTGSGSLLDDLPSSPSGSMLDELPSGPSGSMLDQAPTSSAGSLLGP